MSNGMFDEYLFQKEKTLSREFIEIETNEIELEREQNIAKREMETLSAHKRELEIQQMKLEERKREEKLAY